MPNTNRRIILGGLTLTGLIAGAARAASLPGTTADGHAAGYDAAPAPGLPLLPRRPGDPVGFTHALDSGALKAASGGWAREVTMRQLPLAAGIAGAHLFLNPGGAREMHWHAGSSEWAYVLAGHCQITALDPAGACEVANLEPGDLWYFPAGHAHAIHTLGDVPCHAILAFNDGLYSEHGTFGLSDWLSRLDPVLLAQALGVPVASLAALPAGETYIKQGSFIPLDGPEARAARELAPERSHRYRLMAQKPVHDLPGGTIHIASAREFPMSASMSAAVTRLQPGALYEPHWHANANEFQYLARGRTRVTMFGADKHLAVADMQAGDCAYIPVGCGHSVLNIGTEACEIVSVLDAGAYQENSLTEWLAGAPGHLLANNLGVPEPVLAALPKRKVEIAAAG